MANICTNLLYCTSESKKNKERIKQFITDTFEVFTEEVNEEFMEFDFGSKWAFPHKEMKKFTEALKHDKSLYIRCLSYEFGCDYVEYMRYKNGKWNSTI